MKHELVPNITIRLLAVKSMSLVGPDWHSLKSFTMAPVIYVEGTNEGTRVIPDVWFYRLVWFLSDGLRQELIEANP